MCEGGYWRRWTWTLLRYPKIVYHAQIRDASERKWKSPRRDHCPQRPAQNGWESCRSVCAIPGMMHLASCPFQRKAILPRRPSAEGKSVVSSVVRSLGEDGFPTSGTHFYKWEWVNVNWGQIKQLLEGLLPYLHSSFIFKLLLFLGMCHIDKMNLLWRYNMFKNGYRLSDFRTFHPLCKNKTIWRRRRCYQAPVVTQTKVDGKVRLWVSLQCPLHSSLDIRAESHKCSEEFTERVGTCRGNLTSDEAIHGAKNLDNLWPKVHGNIFSENN